MPFRLDLRVKLSEVRKKTKLQHLTPNFSPAFTLIETLVIIAIIGVLASVAFVSFTNAKEKSLDSRRKSDVMALKQALLSAKIDNGVYKNNLTDGTLTPKYIEKIPQDPILDIPYIYLPLPTNCETTSTCTSFSLITCLDNPNDKEQDDPKNIGCPIASYTAISPQ